MKSPFQTILIIVFLVGFVVAIAVFSGLFSSSSSSTANTPSGVVNMWGVLPSSQMQGYVSDFNANNYGYRLEYTYHDPATMYQELINTLADGQSPDLVLIASDQYAQMRSKLYTIPFSAYNERLFRDTNIDGAQLFVSTEGIGALPLLVDPMVAYYNKDILASRNFISPPKTWDDVRSTIPLLTRRDARQQITQSTIAMGQAGNVTHFKDVLATLFLQTGNQLVVNKRAVLDQSATVTSIPTVEALNFYTSFSNPTTDNYTWSSAFPESLQQFLAGKSAFYLGRASELFSIQSQNPNLNFDVTDMFQSSSSTRAVTYGSFVAVGIMAKAPNPVAAYAAASQLATGEGIDALSKRFSLPPVRRDLLQIAQSNPYVSVFFRSAISAFSWQDPNPASTTSIFRDMINKVNSNTADTQTAIYEANRDLQSVIQQ